MSASDQEGQVSWPERIAGLLLPLGVTLMLLGRGWLTWRWNSPIRELIWEEKWWTPVLARFEITWGHFARTSDDWITPTLMWVGIFLMASALLPWLALLPRLRWMRWILLPAILLVALDAFARWFIKDLQAGVAMEYALRLLSPVALLIFLGKGTPLSGMRQGIVTWILLLAAALTFTGHGLYAIGYYDIPLNFYTMTMEILTLSQEDSLLFLKAAGWLDFIAVALAFLPATRLPALIYMLLWGSATTVARLWAYYDPDLPKYGLDPWLAETLVRTPHCLIPLWLILMMTRAKKTKPANEEEPEQPLEPEEHAAASSSPPSPADPPASTHPAAGH